MADQNGEAPQMADQNGEAPPPDRIPMFGDEGHDNSEPWIWVPEGEGEEEENRHVVPDDHPRPFRPDVGDYTYSPSGFGPPRIGYGLLSYEQTQAMIKRAEERRNANPEILELRNRYVQPRDDVNHG